MTFRKREAIKSHSVLATDIYVTVKTSKSAALARINNLLDSRVAAISASIAAASTYNPPATDTFLISPLHSVSDLNNIKIYGLGRAIENSIKIALEVQKNRNDIELMVKTGTLTLFDDFSGSCNRSALSQDGKLSVGPTSDEENGLDDELVTQTRLQSTICITIIQKST